MILNIRNILKKFTKEPFRDGYICSTCGKRHGGVPMDLHFAEPYFWNSAREKNNPKSSIGSDTCIINGEDFFIKVILEIPVLDSPEKFCYGVWVSLSEKNFKRYIEISGTGQETKEPAYFGWFCSLLKGYAPETIGLKTQVHLRGGRFRPTIEVEDSGHPLAEECRHGITMHRVFEILKTNSVREK